MADQQTTNQGQPAGKPTDQKTEVDITTPTEEKKPEGETGTLLGDQEPPADKKSSTNPEKKGDEETPKKIVPESYEDFKLPEGVALDQDLTDGIKGLAKKYGLSQEEAQEMADLGAKQSQKLLEQQNEFIDNTRKEWVAQAQTDKEFGGEKLQENLAVARKGLQAYASEPLRELLHSSGLGNHPEVIRLFFKLGNQVQNDKPDSGSTASDTAENRLSKLYTSHQK